jgi:hypothetical protein
LSSLQIRRMMFCYKNIPHSSFMYDRGGSQRQNKSTDSKNANSFSPPPPKKPKKYNLPPLDLLHPHMHPVHRLCSNDARGPNLLIRIRHPDLKPPRHSSKQALELRLRKAHPDATPRAVQESDLRIVALRTPRVRRPGLQPPPG